MTPNGIRLKIIALFFLLFSGAIVTRLFTWQIVRGEELGNSARSQQQILSQLPAHRGQILSSDGYPLSLSSPSFLVWASLPKINNPEEISQKLAQILLEEPIDEELLVGKESTPGAQEVVKKDEDIKKLREEKTKEEEDRILRLITKKDVVWIAIKRKVGKEKKQELEKLNIEGIGFTEEEGRNYPEGIMASHILGFVGQDAGGFDKGYFGLEGYYNLTLQGSEGLKSWEKDARGSPILVGDSHQVIASNGISLKTNINRSIQFIVEKYLKEGVQKFDAQGGSIIIMNPKDGAILASASYPPYNPTFFNVFTNERFIDPSISLSFEPGSIFKPIVMGAALDAKVVTPETLCEDCDGPRVIAEYTIESGTKKYYPDTNMIDIILHSDNIGMVWVAERLGLDKMYEYLEKFGIGNQTGIDLQGEVSPKMRQKENWGLIDLATSSFGQGIAVTPIQMVRAIGVIANEGKMVRPRVVSLLIGEDWQRSTDNPKAEQIISKEAAREIADMMVHNVETRDDWKKPQGVKLAGKTGTAQIPIAGHYDPEKTIHSFVGFGPSDNPQFVMLVTLKDPKLYQFASQTAAPIWFDIVREILPYVQNR